MFLTRAMENFAAHSAAASGSSAAPSSPGRRFRRPSLANKKAPVVGGNIADERKRRDGEDERWNGPSGIFLMVQHHVPRRMAFAGSQSN